MRSRTGDERLASPPTRVEGGNGIRAGTVVPGPVGTGTAGRQVTAAPGGADTREPGCRAPDGAASAVGFLSAPGAVYVARQRIAIDGGAF
ncbi:hypothetical protein AB0M32_42600 [Streptomyces sp. NPDC051985]|uniref:hypothetical protein n=1 Tax=Streptomyces sp. NPDC051985 TaxID=3155807 RepID=UPI00342EDE24